MKKAIAIMLLLVLTAGLCACGKNNEPAVKDPLTVEEEQLASYRRVDITKENFEQYFRYKEYISYTKGENSNSISSAQISYGFELREGYLAAEPEGEKATLQVDFVAEGIVNNGSYTINFETLDFSGTTSSSEKSTVSGSLGFWPKGGRTVLYPYGVYRDTYVIRLENFRVTSVSGCIYLLNSFEA